MKLRPFIIALFVMFSFVINAQADKFTTFTSVVTHGAEDAARLAMKKATTEASERIAQQQLKSLTNGAEDMARAAANKAAIEASERAAQKQLRSLTNNADNAARAAANNAAKEASERAAQQQLKTLTKPKPPVAAPLKEAVVSKPLPPTLKNSVRNSEASIASSQSPKLNPPIVKEIKPLPSPVNTGNNYLGKTKSANEYIKDISSSKTASTSMAAAKKADDAALLAAKKTTTEASERTAQQQLKSLPEAKPKAPIATPIKETAAPKPIQKTIVKTVQKNEENILATQNAAKKPVNSLKLNKQLASEQQLAEAGVPIAGSGTKTTLKDSQRLANEYGGNASDWAKRSSTQHVAPDGKKFETHWYQNSVTDQRVEPKTIVENYLKESK